VPSTATQVVIQNNNQRNELDDRITEVEKNLDNLTLRYTEQHPDVVAARRVLAVLRQQRDAQQQQAQAPADGAAAGQQSQRRNEPPKTIRHKVPNPVYDQIQIKLVEAGPMVQTLQRRHAQIEIDYQRLQEQARTALAVETEFMNFDRDYRVIKKNYEELLGRRESARLGSELDSKSDKVQFRIIDPPTVPVQPSSPNRPLLYSLVLIVAIGAGAVFAFALTQVDDSFATTQRLRQAFALPVLGTVTLIASAIDRRKSVLATASFSVVCLVLVMAYGGLMLYPLRHVMRSYLPIS
jgi:polysaccharide chain length determinant protein (PEP-CTERM system associated)